MGDSAALILGDNIFYRSNMPEFLGDCMDPDGRDHFCIPGIGP